MLKLPEAVALLQPISRCCLWWKHFIHIHRLKIHSEPYTPLRAHCYKHIHAHTHTHTYAAALPHTAFFSVIHRAGWRRSRTGINGSHCQHICPPVSHTHMCTHTKHAAAPSYNNKPLQPLFQNAVNTIRAAPSSSHPKKTTILQKQQSRAPLPSPLPCALTPLFLQL